MTLSELPARRSILIVEDEAMIAMMLGEYLDALGHHVSCTASTVEEGLRHARNGGIDLAILDCRLDGEEVWPVAEELDRLSIPFIISSGDIGANVPAAFATRPMLAKPYTIAAIADVLDSVQK